MEMLLNIDMNEDINKRALIAAIQKKWTKATKLVAQSMDAHLGRLMVEGGGGQGVNFNAFTSTSLWSYLQTPQAWGELGFPSLSPLDDLKDALRQSMKVYAAKGILTIKLVNMKLVGQLTPHPAAGAGQLPAGLSWFVDWVIKGSPVRGYHFAQDATEGLSQRSGGAAFRSVREHARSFPIAGQEAGLMIKNGMWSFPPKFRSAVDDWLQSNLSNIKKLSENAIKIAIKRV